MSTRVTQVQFQVEGSGEFPFDMLYHDSCYPATLLDALTLRYHQKECRQVTLLANVPVSDEKEVPARGSWRNFMWRVVPDSRHQVG